MKADLMTDFTQVCPRTLAATEVLDLHADLHRMLTRPDPTMRRIFTEYALEDTQGNPAWRASHMHPATSMDNLDPWFASLGGDLYDADTYQVTAEMIDLAEALRVGTPDLEELREEDLPSESGFMWLDRPVVRPSVEDDEEHPPLLMHAVSWAVAGAVPVRLTDGTRSFTGKARAVRIREWGYCDDPTVIPRPLHLMGQSTAFISGGVRTPLAELQLVHMLWILMGMKITSIRAEQPGRQGRRRAADLARAEVRVVTLRRTERAAAKPSATPKHIDWTCTWLVRGHYRDAPHGGTFKDGRVRTWIAPYIKGPDGLPLRVPDILFKLAK